MKNNKKEYERVWLNSLYGSMEKYDYYDKELIERMRKDWDKVWSELVEDRKNGKNQESNN